jgi:DNA-binding CsgD family transcriptional regulator
MAPNNRDEGPGADVVASAIAALEDGRWQDADALLAPGLAPPGEALLALAFAAVGFGRFEVACTALERAFGAFAARGDARQAAMTAAHLMGLNEFIGADAACAAWEQRGLGQIEAIGPCVERGWLVLGRTGCVVHDPAELRDRAEVALSLAETFGDKSLELRARADKGLALVCLGFVNAGFALLDEVMTAIAAGEMSDDDSRGRATCSMLTACERTGDVGRAQYWCGRIEREALLAHPLLNAHCRVTYGSVESLRGEWQKAESHLSQLLSTGSGTVYHRAVSAGKLAEIMIQLDKLDAAAGVLQGFEDRFEAQAALARLRAANGRLEEAAALLRPVVRGLGQDAIQAAPLLAFLVEVEVQRGDSDAATTALTRLQELDELCDSREIKAYSRLAAGWLARHEKKFEKALAELEDAAALLLRYDRPLLTARVRLETARCLRDLNRTGAAIVEAEAALASLRRLGVAGEVRRAEQLLAALTGGDIAGAPATPTPSALSVRETEIARLVAEGLTNREIAERLVLSVRTVEGHIDRALSKLGFHTRTQLATWFSSQRA